MEEENVGHELQRGGFTSVLQGNRRRQRKASNAPWHRHSYTVPSGAYSFARRSMSPWKLGLLRARRMKSFASFEGRGNCFSDLRFARRGLGGNSCIAVMSARLAVSVN